MLKDDSTFKFCLNVPRLAGDSSFHTRTPPVLTFRRAPRTTPPAISGRATTLPPAEREAAEIMLVLDTVGGVLQAYAQHSFDTEQRTADVSRALLQQWRMHVLIGAAQPDAVVAPGGSTISDRNWQGLIRCFGETRRDEVAAVRRTHGSLRESIWAFVGAIHHLVREEHDEAGPVQDQLDQVKAAVRSNDTARLKRESLVAMNTMATLIAKRRARQQEQYAILADRLRSLGHEIDDSRRESGIDAVTGLPNRKDFDAFVRQCVEMSTLTGRIACLLMIDVDNFKNINDSHGHPIGDMALRQVATALSRTILRKVDFVCRHGGDEFAVVLQETDASSASVIAQKLRRALNDLLDTPKVNTDDLNYTLSIGIAEFIMGEETASWVRRADAALYEAKRGGRNRVAVYSAAPTP